MSFQIGENISCKEQNAQPHTLTQRGKRILRHPLATGQRQHLQKLPPAFNVSIVISALDIIFQSAQQLHNNHISQLSITNRSEKIYNDFTTLTSSHNFHSIAPITTFPFTRFSFECRFLFGLFVSKLNLFILFNFSFVIQMKST